MALLPRLSSTVARGMEIMVAPAFLPENCRIDRPLLCDFIKLHRVYAIGKSTSPLLFSISFDKCVGLKWMDERKNLRRTTVCRGGISASQARLGREVRQGEAQGSCQALLGKA